MRFARVRARWLRGYAVDTARGKRFSAVSAVGGKPRAWTGEGRAQHPLAQGVREALPRKLDDSVGPIACGESSRTKVCSLLGTCGIDAGDRQARSSSGSCPPPFYDFQTSRQLQEDGNAWISSPSYIRSYQADPVPARLLFLPPPSLPPLRLTLSSLGWAGGRGA